MTAKRVVRAGRFRATYSAHRRKRIDGPALRLSNYWQEDYHSCGFLAAFTVAEFLHPEGISAAEVLGAVRPEFNSGTSRSRVVRGLAGVGVQATYCDFLTVFHLRDAVQAGIPVIVSVFPEEWAGDHWTVVQGFSSKRVYLTNHYSMSLDWFNYEWIDSWGDGATTGAGLVCRRVD